MSQFCKYSLKRYCNNVYSAILYLHHDRVFECDGLVRCRDGFWRRESLSTQRCERVLRSPTKRSRCVQELVTVPLPGIQELLSNYSASIHHVSKKCLGTTSMIAHITRGKGLGGWVLHILTPQPTGAFPRVVRKRGQFLRWRVSTKVSVNVAMNALCSNYCNVLTNCIHKKYIVHQQTYTPISISRSVFKIVWAQFTHQRSNSCINKRIN